MSAKDDYSNNKAKDFFILHGEKLAFGVCLLLVVVFFVLGRGVKSLEPNKAPSTLSSRVVAANLHMNELDEKEWKNQIEDAREPNFDLEEIVIEGRKPIEYTPYYSYLYLPAREPQALRKDPNLLPPSKPLLTAINGAIALPPTRDLESPLDVLEFATVEKKESKPTRTRNDRDQVRGEFGGGAGSDLYSGGYAETEDEDPVVGTTDSAEPEFRQLSESNFGRLPGFRLQESAGIPVAYSMVAGTATLPIREQWLEYKRTFEDAIGFDPRRDRPIYMWYEVQRQDVTDRPDGSIDPDQWKDIVWTKSYLEWYRPKYKNGPPPIVDMAYYEGSTGRRYDFALTSPIPIILLRDIEDFALHPDTPKRKPVALTDEPETDEADPTEEPDVGPGPIGLTPMGEDDFSPEAESYGEYGSGDAGAAAGEGMYGMTPGSESSDFDPETGPAAPLKLVRFFDLKAEPGRKYRYRIRVTLVDPNNPLPGKQSGAGTASSAGQETYSDGGQAYGGYVSGGDSSATSQGDSSSGEVSLRWLAKEVRERVEKIRQADEAKYGKDELGNPIRLVEWRYTDWSQPSDIVIVSERGEQVLAGAVTPPKERRIDENVSFAVEEPKGKLVVSEWNPKYAVEVPAEKEVSLGTLLNFTAKADVLHPIKLLIKRIPEYQFKTDALVLDMRGGQMLPGSDKENVISAPGEFLVVDADGQLHAQNELDDMDEFRLKLLMPDEEELEPEDGNVYGDDFGTGEAGGGVYDAFEPGGRSGRRSNRGA